ncbi:MAG: peptidoglycan editing factor PgeF [Terriglobales bacterium]
MPSRPQIEVLRAGTLARLPWLVHGFSTRLGGWSECYGGDTLNLGFTKDDSRAAVERNRAAFVAAVGASGWPLAAVRQFHSDLVWRADCEHPGAGDGLLTGAPGTLLAVRTADCLPILLADVKKRAVAAVHAGWRGTLKRIAEKAVGEMRRCFGSRPEDLRAAIGPGIHACCYEIGEEVREQFQSQFAYADALFTETKESDTIHERYPLLFLIQRAPGHIEPHLPVKIRLDLTEANRRQLLAAGLNPRSIWASPLCTACRTDLLFSHRAEKGHTGRMMAVIGIRP